MNEDRKITKEALGLSWSLSLTLCPWTSKLTSLCPAQALSKMAGNSEIYFNCPVELLCVNNDVKPITARMMQEYEFSKEETFSTTASTLIGPSEQVLRNIIDFARCYQNVECGNVQVRFFLN